MTLYGAYLFLFGDADEDDSAAKWWEMYMIDNLSQQYNLADLGRSAKSMLSPVVIGKLYQTGAGAAEMIMATVDYAIGNEDDAYTKQGDFKGWNKTSKGLPGVASAVDLINKFDRAKSVKELDWFDGMNEGVRLK
jgi:hypothetical protein